MRGSRSSGIDSGTHLNMHLSEHGNAHQLRRTRPNSLNKQKKISSINSRKKT